ncbi:MAG: hypothetical protein HY848_09495 [Betaproteobacteria bacterium]|nr:hypothetical protein [Betaproteobacteria bacterium]
MATYRGDSGANVLKETSHKGDTLIGGLGNDTYYWESGTYESGGSYYLGTIFVYRDTTITAWSTTIEEGSNQGDDTVYITSVQSGRSIAATEMANIERIYISTPVAISLALDGGPGHDTLTGRGGQDIFVLRAGDGGATLQLADLITDFQDGIDRLGLAGSLTYVDLKIAQGTGANAVDAIISTSSGEYLAVLQNLLATNLNSQDFVHL